MPEGDRFERAFAMGWRTAYRRARGPAASPAEVADACLSALAKTLRERGGVPGLRAIEGVLTGTARRLGFPPSPWAEGARELHVVFDQLDRIVRDGGGHRHTKVAADVAKALLVQMIDPVSRPDGRVIRRLFVERVTVGLVEHYFFGRARPNLLAEGKLRTPGEAAAWQQAVEACMRPGIRTMAERLIKDPSAGALRAPRRITARQPTKVLLEEALVSR